MEIKKTVKANKRVSQFMKNADHAAYQAYKQIVKTDSSRIERSSDVSGSRHNTMKYPFLLTAQRFRWQDNKNKGETVELVGNMSSYKFKNSTNGRWEELLNKSADNIIPRKSVDKRTKENDIASRTLSPLVIDCNQSSGIRINTDLSPSARTKAVGSIYNLLQAIPDPDYSVKKHHEKRNISSVFSKEFNDVKVQKRLRKNFNFDKIKNSEYAGFKKENNENSYVGIK